MPPTLGAKGKLALRVASQALLAGSALVLAAVLGGCARGGPEGAAPVPSRVLDVVLTYAGPVNDAFYYFIAIDADDDPHDGPIPVASGPYWGNGWGTGSMTHYVEYHQGVYQVYRPVLQPILERAGGGLVAASGTPQTTDAGTYTLTVESLQLGAVSVEGDGMITGAHNQGDQNAGVLALRTDATGNLVAGSVSFTPAADGGRPLTAQEQQQMNLLNAGGQRLQATSFAFLGLALELGPPRAGEQRLTVAPTVGTVRGEYLSLSPPQQARTFQGTVRANSATPTPTPPVPGLILRAADLQVGGSARLLLAPAQTGLLVGPPYDFQRPSGTCSLRVTLDLTQIAPSVDWVSLNFISATELLFDPQQTERDHCYDAIGLRGNDYITLRLAEYGTYRNGQGFVREGADDPTLQGRASAQEKAQVDLVDWQVTIRRL
jgi:hypothetical protein